MSGRERKLKLPGKLAMSTLGIALALAGAGCGDDDRGGRDAAADAAREDAAARDSGSVDSGIADSGVTDYFCYADSSMDGGPMFDAAVCGGFVESPEDCPPGCSVAIA